MLLCVCSHWNNQGTIRNHYMAISIITPPQRYRKVLAGQFDDVSGTFLNRCPCQSMRVGMMGNDGECPMHNQRHCLRFTPTICTSKSGCPPTHIWHFHAFPLRPVSLQEKSTTCCGQEVANKNVMCNYCKRNGAKYNKYNYWPWNSSMQIYPIESQRRGSATWHFEHYVQTAVPPTDHHIYTDFSMATFILSPQ